MKKPELFWETSLLTTLFDAFVRVLMACDVKLGQVV